MDTGAWLTAVHVARLPQILTAIHRHPPPGIPADRADRIVWRSCNGPLNEVPQLIIILTLAELVSSGSTLRLTKTGRRVATQDHQHNGTLLAQALIRSGFFADQVRRLTELSQIHHESGEMICRRSVAIENCPQLAGLLRRFPGVSWEEELRVPAFLRSVLVEIWALLPTLSLEKIDQRKAIGNRGELYSYYFEQLRADDPNTTRWVARDDESLGYDIEDIATKPQRRIEVKASRAAESRFFLSANELNVACSHGEHYEIHFWGTINLDQTPADEYHRLRVAGYPIIYGNLSQRLKEGSLIARPTQYLIESA